MIVVILFDFGEKIISKASNKGTAVNTSGSMDAIKNGSALKYSSTKPVKIKLSTATIPKAKN